LKTTYINENSLYLISKYNHAYRIPYTHIAKEAIMQKRLIISDPKVMMGKPVIEGTRITVEMILEKLSSGETVEQILEAHPRLTEESIRAALAFAAQVLRADVIYPVAEAVS